jgi:hypothetical protein
MGKLLYLMDNDQKPSPSQLVTRQRPGGIPDEIADGHQNDARRSLAQNNQALDEILRGAQNAGYLSGNLANSTEQWKNPLHQDGRVDLL